MKKTILLLLSPVLLLLIILQLNGLSFPRTASVTEHEVVGTTVNTSDVSFSDKSNSAMFISKTKKHQHKKNASATGYIPNSNEREDLVNYAFTLLGSPYVYGGTTPDGFDCSGFITHVFDRIGVSVKRSSGLQATEGVAIDRRNAAPGDLLIFTGTDKTVREPGHVGIVISEPGDTIEFIHSSSSRRESGVKVSQVEGSGYDERFLEVRRIL